ncbi:MAG: ABC transporter ATP-binding protein [Clostridium butyricum]|nr:ABC transporter ATP-binding protein [Clostridium butyricum]
MSIKIEKLLKKFDNSVALNEVSVDIKDKEFIAILGPSGCGKTTLLRLIGGFVEPTDGSIECNGKIYSNKKKTIPVEERDLGMVFQSFALWPHMTVREHIMFPLDSKKYKKMNKEQKINLVEKALVSTGLEKLAERLPGELSGGQKQRVALARAIVSKPKILLMDEPLSALDAELKISMRKEIQDIHRNTEATIIYVTHDQSEALAMADRIIVMKDGKIEQVGTPNEIYLNPETEFVATFVSKCNIVKGQWIDKDSFKVEGSNIIYLGENIADNFKENGIYPVRPEEFKIYPESSVCEGENSLGGISGIIVNKQYQGREIHYSVKCNNGVYTVYECNNKFNVDDKVYIHKIGREYDDLYRKKII